MKSKPKLIILATVFLLSTVFFWAAINQLLIPSRAAGEKGLSAFIFEESVPCNSNANCSVSVYVSSDVGDGISGVTGKINYSENLSFVGSGEKGILETELNIKDDSQARAVKFSYVSLKSDAELKSGGPHKIATLIFKPTVNSGAATLTLAEASVWQAVGSVPFAVFPESKATNVTISDTIPAPKDGGSCVAGDCNCDGTVNMLDFESMRPGLVSEAPAKCDLDADGNLDSRDYQMWKNNAFPAAK